MNNFNAIRHHPFTYVRLVWLLLLGMTLVFALLYLISALFPGPLDPAVTKYFSLTLAIKARAYNSAPRVLYVIRISLQIIALAWLSFSRPGQAFFQRLRRLGRNYWLSAALAVLATWLIINLISLPFSYYLEYYWQKIWGFGTQPQPAWWMDYLKNTGIDLLITLAGGLVFFWVINRFSRLWWLMGAALFSFWLVVQYFLWPIVVAPLFNQFQPVPNPAVVSMVQNLAQRAGLKVDEVLVMDASKQTTAVNAYFTGIGASKRIVIYDNLLNDYSLPEVKAVIAHEMGHWRHGDVTRGLFYGMLGAFAVFALLTFLLRPWLPKNEKKPSQLWAALQLALLLLLFAGNPLQNAVSRQMETNADRFSLELTGDLPAEIRLQQDLARTNLADMSPPAFIVWFSYDHPPALTRIRDLIRENS